VKPLSVRGSLATIAVLGGLIFGSSVASAAPAPASSGLRVYVGYADNVRADAVSFPTPWQGSPNTIFEGCTPAASCTYDGGAVQLFNGSSRTVHVNAVVVTLGTCVFNGWDPTDVAAGDSLIVTQLKSGSTHGCTQNSPANMMDTSDVGPNGQSWTGVCAENKDDLIATVDITVDGTTTRYYDSGQVLNTGGFDVGACVAGANESTQWTVIGNQPCHSSALTLAPVTQTHPVFTTATVTATFSACGEPLANAPVDFAVTAGPNASPTAHGFPTNAQGQASFSYSSTQVGTDTVGASISNLAGTIGATPVTVIWTAGFAQGGAFVIGDLENVQNNAAYWWGAQWWKYDPLSSGLAPAAFKGFEDSNATPWCGDSWTARPGNSSRPPKSVTPYMAVIVSSHITKSGPTISGDVVGIVVVKTDAGYGPNPGHRGTGKIVATLCGSSASAGSTPPLPASHGKGASGNPHPALPQRGRSSSEAAGATAVTSPVAATQPSATDTRKKDLPPQKARGKPGR
jgi:hypothetical protein